MNTQQNVEVKSVQYMVRRNLGNYEHEEITLVGSVSEGTSPFTAALALKDLAYKALYTAKEECAPKATKLVTEKVLLAESPRAEATFVKEEGEKTTYAQADGTTSEVDGDIPPPIPAEAAKKPRASRASKPVESAKAAATTTAPADEWEEVASPYVKNSEESAAGTKAVGEKVVGKVKQAVETPHINYDKSIKEHRSTLATYLGENHPTWKDLSKEKISELTTDLTGKPFLDVKGNIVSEFKAEVALYF